MAKKDILIFMSDQHTPYVSGYFGNNADTPNMDALAKNGTNFSCCYSSCPLCVPARMSMMSGQYAKNTGVYTNNDAFSNVQPSVLHPIVQAGYETVLCGRMHFVGLDQRHGFTKRIAPDITSVTWNRPDSVKEERGVFNMTFWAKRAADFAGGGKSPVINYDDLVVEKALEYLSEEHEKPQLIVVGVYGPHSPYVAPKELFEKYYNKVAIPDNFGKTPGYMNEALEGQKYGDVSNEKERAVLAAYYALVELTDMRLGKVVDAFERYTKMKGSEGIVCYLSDHGDQLGERGIYGKNNFFERSARIPMIFCGDGVERGKIERSPCSIIDLGPTLWDITESEKLFDYDGESLAPVLFENEGHIAKDRAVYSETMSKVGGSAFGEGSKNVYGVMVRKNEYKYIRYHNMNEMLFDVEKDPDETKNLVEELPTVAEKLRKLADDFSDADMTEKRQDEHDVYVKWFKSWETAAGLDESERWKDNPIDSRDYPEICFK